MNGIRFFVVSDFFVESTDYFLSYYEFSRFFQDRPFIAARENKNRPPKRKTKQQKALFRAQLIERRNQGRAKSRWADGVNSDRLALGVRDLTHCAQDRQSWKDLLGQALTKYWL
jgi:hypothetical protein